MSPRLLVTSSWLPALVTALTAVVVLLSCDVPAGELAAYLAYLGLGVAVPGVFTWRLLLQRLHDDEEGRPTWFEDLSLGTILGFGVQLPFFLFGVAVGVPLLVLTYPALALVLAVTPWGRRVWSLPTARLDPAVSWGLSVVSIYGLAWLKHDVLPLRPLSLPPNKVPGVDETFHQALVADIANRFPPEIPYLLDTRLDYHWFVHGQIAASGELTGVDSVTALRFVLPVTLLLLLVTGLGAVALRLAGRPVAAFIAPALLVVGVFHLMGPDFRAGAYVEPFRSVRFVTSPSQTYGVVMSMPALMLILEVLRTDRRAGRRVWVAVALAMLALSGSKATFLPIFLCGTIGAWGVRLLVQRRIDRAATGLVALVLLATVFAQFVIFGGSTGSLSLDPLRTVDAALGLQGMRVVPMTVAVMTAMLLTSWLLYGVGAIGLLSGRGWLDSRAVFLLVCVSAGVTASLLFFRSGSAQMWFQRSVAELIVLVSAWGMAKMLPRPLTFRPALRLVGVAGAAGLAAYVVSAAVVGMEAPRGRASYAGLALTVLAPFAIVVAYLALRALITRFGDERRSPGPALLLACLLGLGTTNAVHLAQQELSGDESPSHVGPDLFAKGGVAAAEYVRAHSAVDDVVATNMHCTKPREPRCDNRHFWLSAYSERRVVIEGWGYSAPTNALASPEMVNSRIRVPFPDRLKDNDAAFVRPSETTVGTLIDRFDVKWLVASKRYPVDLAGLRALDDLVTTAFENSNYVVFEVR